MKGLYRYGLALAAICSSLLLSGGCGSGSDSVAPALSGRAISEVVGGAIGSSPRDSPLPNALLSFRVRGVATEVAHVRTDAAGNYSVSLPIGTYEVSLGEPASEPGYNSVDPAEIVVSPGEPQTVDIKFILDAP